MALRVIEDGYRPGLRAVAEGRWTSADTDRWQTLGISRLGYLADDGQPNVDFLRELDGLEDLIITGRVVEDDTAVEACSHLRHLHVDDTQTKPFALDQLHRLESLRLVPDRSGTTDLRRLTRLRALSGYWRSETLERLEGCVALTTLDLVARNLRSLDGIQDLHDLRSLSLAYAPRLADLAPLGACTRLRSLHLEALTSLESLDVLATMHGLERLFLLSCRNLDSLAPLRALPNLRHLNLGGTSRLRDGRIRAVLQDLPNLVTVNLGAHPSHYDVTRREIAHWTDRGHAEGGS